MERLELIPPGEFTRVASAGDPDARLALLADMCRVNALVAVKRAGSGHLGSTFSSLDLVAHLLWEELNVAEVGFDSPDRDVFFSSKGHDVPGLYAALNALGIVPTERLLRLRRLGGLDGHPDVGVPGIEANSGSLGMGISKARGIAWAKRHLGRGGRVVVMTGDGELQEGQNWEALQAAAHQRVGRLLVVVDRNELQSDKPTEEISRSRPGGEARGVRLRVVTCDGHDHAALRVTLRSCGRRRGRHARGPGRPDDQGKGRLVHGAPAALAAGGGTYRWHAGAPDDDAFAAAAGELASESLRRRGRRCRRRQDSSRSPARGGAGREPPGRAREWRRRPPRVASRAGSGRVRRRRLRRGAARAGRRASRGSSCSTPTSPPTAACVRSSSPNPDRFVESGIAEQDMVSMAAGMARHGLLPVVNSFASFLASRANEQIYNQASERTKVVYAMHYAGLIPAGPGKSHQSLRDVSLLAAMPGITVVHPCNAEETRALVEWAVVEADESVAIRLAIGPSPRRIELPAGYRPVPGTAAPCARAPTRCSSRTGR